VAAGVDVTAANRYGVTPLYSAALNGNARMLELLLDAGADPNATLPEGETTLMTASLAGRVDALRLLLAGGADANAREEWKQQTALMWAAHEGNTDAVRLLVEAGAEVDARSLFGWTPFLLAARQGELDVLEALLDAGADIDQTLPDGTGALVSSIQGLNYEAASLLLDHGIDVNGSDQGWSALHQVVWSRRPQRGQNNPGQKPSGDVSSLELARKLVALGANINATQTREPHRDMAGRNNLNRYGSTPFLLAAKACDVPMMQVLLDLGADPFMTQEDGTTPLMVAAGVGILSQGENPGTPEESAVAVRLLLGLGADPNDIDRNGETALHGPAWRGSNEAVMHLVEAGAKLDARNNREWLPLTIAAGVYSNAQVQSNPHTAQLLEELMLARGLDTSDKDTGLGGALRSEIIADDQLGVTNPAEVQQRLIEQQQEMLRQLEELEVGQ
jgi:ankyrin repeat protein